MVEKDHSCIICGSNSFNEADPSRRITYVDCERCGKYIISDEAETFYGRNKTDEWIPILSYWIRKHQGKKPPLLKSRDIERIVNSTDLPKVKEQADNLVLWIGQNATTPDHSISEKTNNLAAVIGTKEAKTIKYIVNSLAKKNLLYSITDSGDKISVSLSFDGWQYYEELKTSNTESTLGFMAMSFSNEELQTIYNKHIKQAVNETGFEIRRVDEEKRAGLIDDKLRVEIRRSKFLISDLTDDNNGAYWEAGYAEGLGIPVIYICEKQKFDRDKSHFDTNHHLTVIWDKDNLDVFVDELKATIRATFPTEAKMED